MNKAVKKVLAYLVSILLVIGLIAAAPISRSIYYFYDNNRTQEILKQLEAAAEAAASAAAEETAPVNSFLKQAYVMQSQEEGLRTFDLLVLTSETSYELSHYEQTITESSSYTSEYFHMMGDYTRDGNVITVQPGIGVLSVNPDGTGFTHHNAQFLTAEEAAGEMLRDEVYAAKYASNKIALMRDGSFVVGGTSDASDVLDAPAGRHVYTDAVLQGRVTFKTLVTFDDGQYILYSESTNSSNAEQTTGAFFGFGTYEITEQNVAPDENAPEQTYNVVSGEVGRGYMYANNNGSHMQFDLQNDGSFSQWLATSFNAGSPTFYATESGCTIKIGALKTVVAPWGLYVPASDAKETAETKPAETQPAATAPAQEQQSLRLEVASSVEDKPFILELKGDGTLTTGWTNYEQTLKTGKWAVADGTLTLDLEEAGYTASVRGNTITVNYGQMGEKEFTIPEAAASAMGLKASAPAQALTMEVASSVEDKPFVLTLNGDGTAITGWTNYEQTMKEGTWAVADGSITFDLGDYTAETVMNEDGTASITVNYGQMGEKVYTMPAAAVQVIIGAPAAAAEPAPQALTLKVDSSVEDKPFVLTLNGDGTAITGWTNYEQTMKEGTWAVADGTLTFNLGDYTAETVMNEDGTASITVNYGQMGEKVYTMPAAAVQVIIGAPAAAAEPAPQALTMKVDSSVEDKPFVLTLNGDGTAITGWTNYEQTMKEGTWAVADGALTFDLGDYTAETVMNEDGTASITVNYGQMGEKVYTMPAAAVQVIIGVPAATEPAPAQSLTLEVETSVEGKPFVLTLNGDGTVITGWTNYEQTVKEGKWTLDDGILSFDLEEAGYSAVTILNEDGTAAIVVDYGQMGEKEYALSAEAVAAMGLKAHAPLYLTLEVETSVEGKPFVLTLNGDGTLVTGWTNYEQTMKEGKWAVVDDALTFDLEEAGYSVSTVLNADGTATITVNYGQMGEKEYALSAEMVSAMGLKAAPAPQALTLEVETSVEGKPFVLTLNGDGTVITGWTNYEQTMKEGKWAVTDGTLTFDLEEAGYSAMVAAGKDGTAIITVNYGQMGDKVYTMPAAAVSVLKMEPEADALTLELETSVEGKPFVLTLNSDSTVITGWTNYEQTIKEGKWDVIDETLTFDLEGTDYTAAVTTAENGDLVITVNYGQMGDKEYTLPTAEIPAWLH